MVAAPAKPSLIVEAGDTPDEVVVSVGSGGARTRLRVAELLQLIRDAAGSAAGAEEVPVVAPGGGAGKEVTVVTMSQLIFDFSNVRHG